MGVAVGCWLFALHGISAALRRHFQGISTALSWHFQGKTKNGIVASIRIGREMYVGCFGRVNLLLATWQNYLYFQKVLD